MGATPRMLDIHASQATARRTMLQTIWGTGEGYVCIAHLDLDPAAKKKLYHEFFDRSDLDWTKIDEFIAQGVEKGYQVYYSAAVLNTRNINSKTREGEANIASTRILFADCDSITQSARLRRFKHAPTYLIETSPGNRQALWVVNDPLPVDEMRELTRTLVYTIGADKAVHEPNRLLRMPGTLNVKPKYGPDFPTSAIIGVGRKTTISAMAAAIAAYAGEEATKPHTKVKAANPAPKLRYWLKKLGKVRPDLLKLAKGLDDEGLPLGDIDRSGQFNRLGKSLFELRFRHEVVKILLEFANDHLMWETAKSRGKYTEPYIESQLIKFREEVRADRMALMDVKTLDQFEKKEWDWVWDGMIPLAALTMVEGDGGVGKTTAMTDLIARFTTGQPMPHTERVLQPPGNVLIIAGEESLTRSTVGKVEAAGGDPSRIVTLPKLYDARGYERGLELPMDRDLLEDFIVTYNLKMIYLEPLSDFVGEGIRPDEQGLRKMTRPLISLADEYNVAMITLRHWNKSRDVTSLADKGLGSVALRNIPRSSLTLFHNPETHERGLIQQKNNLRPDSKHIVFTYHIESAPNSSDPRMVWEKTYTVTHPDDVLKKSKPEQTTKLDNVSKAILEILADNPDGLRNRELRQKVLDKGHAGGTYQKAMARLRTWEKVTDRQEGVNHYIELNTTTKED